MTRTSSERAALKPKNSDLQEASSIDFSEISGGKKVVVVRTMQGMVLKFWSRGGSSYQNGTMHHEETHDPKCD
jgi:hypothetical protein